MYDLFESSGSGGCSNKMGMKDLRILFERMNDPAVNDVYTSEGVKSDAGFFCIGNTIIAASLDVIYPMIRSPKMFGAIAALHSLNDIYAVLASPKVGLCILGVPAFLDINSSTITDMLSSARDILFEKGVTIIGGHTLTNQQGIFLGYTIIGGATNLKPEKSRESAIGYSIILTKPLGSTIATLRWKTGMASDNDHSDVLEALLQCNDNVAKVAQSLSLNFMTDVSGFGFLGHLYNIISGLNLSAEIFLEKIKIFKSILSLKEDEILQSSQYYQNIDFLKGRVNQNGGWRYLDTDTSPVTRIIVARETP
jgi:selenide,water dikinase